jgi:RNA polymerase sigma-70 factor (ECF subfamily)
LLAERIAAGDPAAEDTLARMLGPRVFMILARRLYDRDAAREASNEVLMSVVSALRAGRVREPARLMAFVHGVAVNVAAGRRRSAARRPRTEPFENVEEQWAAPAVAVHDERIDCVRAALEDESPTDRQILTLTLVEGLKPGEIAARLRLSPELVRVRKSRAVRRLADRLRADDTKHLGRTTS